MIHGVVDLGSNTVRLSIYQCEEGSARLLMNRKVTAGLADYVEGGTMTPQGIQTASQILMEYQDLMKNLGFDQPHVFATASLRNISNTEDAVAQIQRDTGLSVDVLSGAEEARLSYLGAVGPTGPNSGLLIDLGGGSTELVHYRGDRSCPPAPSLWVPYPCLASMSLTYIPQGRSGRPSGPISGSSWTTLSPLPLLSPRPAGWAVRPVRPVRWQTACLAALRTAIPCPPRSFAAC